MVNLVGYLNHVLGLGESARQFKRALCVAEIPHACAALELDTGAPRYAEEQAPWLWEAELPYDVTVLWCNPDRYGIDVELAALPGDTLVGRWAWELSELPVQWRSAAADLDEIWTASEFVRQAVTAAVSTPARVMPMAVHAPAVGPLERSRWELPEDRPMFLFMFDHHSVMARKNPLGLIDAFAEAFAAEQKAVLLIKTINAGHVPQEAAKLEAASREHPAIRVLDVALSRAQTLMLLSGCDCYVSLHRAEGFGMTIAEAMAYGRPVIATDYGGSTEFLDEGNGFPVAWGPVRIGEGAFPYPREGVWAEPEIDRAAAMMRAVVAERNDAEARGRRARERISSGYTFGAVAEVIARELRRLCSGV